MPSRGSGQEADQGQMERKAVGRGVILHGKENPSSPDPALRAGHRSPHSGTPSKPGVRTGSRPGSDGKEGGGTGAVILHRKENPSSPDLASRADHRSPHSGTSFQACEPASSSTEQGRASRSRNYLRLSSGLSLRA